MTVKPVMLALEGVKTDLRDDIAWYDVKEAPFSIFGVYHDGLQFRRIPQDVADATNPGVSSLCRCTAGGRVRFSTNSPYIAIAAKFCRYNPNPHMAAQGQSGFDLAYEESEGYYTFKCGFAPWGATEKGYSSLYAMQNEGKTVQYQLNMPLYNEVLELYVGISKDATIGEGKPYPNDKPIVYYGSSITQGACAIRPSNAYEEMISRSLNLDYRNIGFSDSALGEDAIVSYLAEQEMSLFVSDYDHNARTIEMLEATHEKLYLAIREKHPDIPYVMVTRPSDCFNPADRAARFAIVKKTYENALARGDKNVYFVSGYDFFPKHLRGMDSSDGTHPSDIGFYFMAKSIGGTIAKALGLHCDLCDDD